MVGTNRSKGCRTCIRRKVKCGAEKPVCLRCITARIECEGYIRDLRWVEDKHSAPRKSSRSKSSSASASASSQSPQKALTGPLTEVYLGFFKHKFVSDDSDHGSYSHMRWMNECLSTKADDASNLAISALMSLFFARMHGNSKSVLAQSNTYYGKALRQLQASIECPDNAQSSLTPAALALTYFEFVAYHSEGGWLHHAGGIGRLMELSGPHRYQEYPEHGYFLLARPLILVAAMSLRETTFLAASEWKTVPWEKYPETKTPCQQMMDLWAVGPSIARDILMVPTAPDTLNTVVARLTDITRSMVEWRWKWEDTNRFVVTEQAVNPSSAVSVDSSGSPIFSTVFHYENTRQMMEIMYYNFVLITLTYCAACLYHPKLVEDTITTMLGSDTQVITNPLGFPGNGIPQTYGSGDICRSIEYALDQTSGAIGVLTLLLPLRVCVFTFALQDAHGAWRSWIATVCDRIASVSGLALARRLKYLPRLHPSQNIEEESSEEEKLNIANTTLPLDPDRLDITVTKGPRDPVVGASFPAAAVGATIDSMIESRRKACAA